MSLNRNYSEIINLLFVLPFGLYLNILKTEEILQFWGKKFSTCVARLSTLMYRVIHAVVSLLRSNRVK